MRLGNEEFNQRPGHQRTPAVLPHFDEVGLLRNQFLDFLSDVFLVPDHTNRLIEGCEGSAFRRGESTGRQIRRRIGTRIRAQLVAEGPGDLPTIRPHA